MKIQSKLPEVGTTIFTVMSQLAAEHGAINLSQGFPDFPVDGDLKELVSKYMRLEKNQYAPMSGVAPLCEAISKKIALSTGHLYDPQSEITVTAGATEAIYAAITALVSEGDEVLIFTPAYDCYVPAVQLNKGRPVFVELRGPDFKVDWNEVEAAISSLTRLIIVNSPHNPTASLWSDSDMRNLEQVAEKCGAYVLSDEVYEHIIFDGAEHCSAAKYPQLAERSLIVASFGKTFHATGWKVGYTAGPKYLMEEFRKVHQFLVFSVNTPVQYALAEYLSEAARYEQLGAFYQAKRDLFVEAIADSKFKALKAAGTYFQLLDYSALSQASEVDFARELTVSHGLAAIPISVFYAQSRNQQLLRFCFAKGDETLLRAAEILNKL